MRRLFSGLLGPLERGEPVRAPPLHPAGHGLWPLTRRRPSEGIQESLVPAANGVGHGQILPVPPS
jgi:hypothetical protein